MSERTRAWLYRVMLAAVALAAGYSLIADDQVAGWVGLITAVFGNGLATLHTDTSV